ncbi:hypothetical protein GCM10007159_42460 [Modicisalibacter luteus]|nr:hypothetical protein GCM10007159_42460 [Halomonas lutea]
MTNQPLAGQRALVTGASSGIGRAIACAFAEAGASVVVNYRSSREEAEQVARDIQQRGGKAIAVQADVSEPEGCETLFGAIERELGGIDVLVANLPGSFTMSAIAACVRERDLFQYCVGWMSRCVACAARPVVPDENVLPGWPDAAADLRHGEQGRNLGSTLTHQTRGRAGGASLAYGQGY